MVEQISATDLIGAVAFDATGLVPAIAQDAKTGEVLMLAWMDRGALRLTLETGDVTYWSRSRKELWRKGATSGHTQRLVEAYVDCDGDTLLLKVEQVGAACHTGTPTCFFRKVER
jgi:phosphoribosyl-AMP cyclohydrolase